jgi:hypothetical protein
MRMLLHALVLLPTATTGFASDMIKIASPDKTGSVIVDKSRQRDLIFVRGGPNEHRLSYNDLDAVFKPRLATTWRSP